MTETTQMVIAAMVALSMVALARSRASADLRAAIRTTVVVILGWGLAYAHYELKSWSSLSWQVQGMFRISLLAVVCAWLCLFRAIRTRPVSPGAVADRVNVGFAAVFAALFLSQDFSAQSALLALTLVGGTVVLAFGSR